MTYLHCLNVAGLETRSSIRQANAYVLILGRTSYVTKSLQLSPDSLSSLVTLAGGQKQNTGED